MERGSFPGWLSIQLVSLFTAFESGPLLRSLRSLPMCRHPSRRRPGFRIRLEGSVARAKPILGRGLRWSDGPLPSNINKTFAYCPFILPPGWRVGYPSHGGLPCPPFLFVTLFKTAAKSKAVAVTAATAAATIVRGYTGTFHPFFLKNKPGQAEAW